MEADLATDEEDAGGEEDLFEEEDSRDEDSLMVEIVVAAEDANQEAEPENRGPKENIDW
jgi:hypothetical protein